MNVIEKVCKLVEKVGYEGAIKAMQSMIDAQGVRTLEQLEDAIDEELILLQEV